MKADDVGYDWAGLDDGCWATVGGEPAVLKHMFRSNSWQLRITIACMPSDDLHSLASITRTIWLNSKSFVGASLNLLLTVHSPSKTRLAGPAVHGPGRILDGGRRAPWPPITVSKMSTACFWRRGRLPVSSRFSKTVSDVESFMQAEYQTDPHRCC